VASFTPVQLRVLHKQLHEHTQLLLQLHGLTARSPSPRHAAPAAASRALLAQLAARREHAFAAAAAAGPRAASRYPPVRFPSCRWRFTAVLSTLTHASVFALRLPPFCPPFAPSSQALFTGDVVGPLYCAPSGALPPSHRPAADAPALAVEAWWPAPPRAPLSTLLDIPSLAMVPDFLSDVDAAPPAEMEAEEEAEAAEQAEQPALLLLSDVPMLDGDDDGGDDDGPALATTAASKSNKRRRGGGGGDGGDEARSVLPAVPPAIAAALCDRFGDDGVCSRALVAAPVASPPSGKHALGASAFTRAEDALLATGVHTFGSDYAAVRAALLPHKSALQLAHRLKNVTADRRRTVGGQAGGSSASAGGAAWMNPVRAARAAVLAPLRGPEAAALAAAVALLRPGRSGSSVQWPRVASHVRAAGRVRRPAATLHRLWRDAASARAPNAGATAAAAAVASASAGGYAPQLPQLPLPAPPAGQGIRASFLDGPPMRPAALTARALVDAPLPPMQRHTLLERAIARGDVPRAAIKAT
jgi:hypothetical protein